MRSDFITIISILLFAKWTYSEYSQTNKLDKTREYYQLIANNPNDTNITINYWNGNGTNLRDKRALGIFLQGLAQALGYNTTPVQIASLPNPNTSGTSSSGPVSIDIRSINQMNSPPPPSPPPGMPSPPPAAPVPARQRETLRFTGVVNFGNNSDILGHLRQYERLFHGSTMPPGMMMNSSSTTSSPVPSSTTQASPSTLPPPRAPLLEPFLVPIPIPLAESLRYPKPLISVVTSTAIVPTVSQSNEKIYENKNKIENYKIESEEIRGDRNLNINMRLKNGGKILKNNENRENEIEEKNKKRRPVQNDDDDGSDEGGEKESYENKEKNPDNENLEDEEDSRENYEDEESEEGEKKKEKIEEEEEEEELEDELKKEEEEEAGGDGSNEDSEEYKEQDEEKESVDDQDNYYSNKKNVRYPPGVGGSKLPVAEQKFAGKLMDSYGQSLEHEGRIDESIADYFGRYKDPNSGLYDQRRIALAEARKNPQWTEPDLKRPENKKHEDKKSGEDEKPQLPRRSRNNKKRKENEEETKLSSSKKYRRPEKKRNESTEESLRKEKTFEADKTQSSESREKTKENNRAPFIIKTFDFVKNSAYYKPVQYIYPEESLQKNAQKIISSSSPDNYNENKKEKNTESEEYDENKEEGPVRERSVPKSGKLPQDEKTRKSDNRKLPEENREKTKTKNQRGSRGRTMLKRNNTRARSTPFKSNPQSEESGKNMEPESTSKNPTIRHADSKNSQESLDANQTVKEELKNCDKNLRDHGANLKNEGRKKNPVPRRPESAEESEEFYDEPGPSTARPAEFQYDEEASEVEYDQVPPKTVHQQPLVLQRHQYLSQNLKNKEDEKILDKNLSSNNGINQRQNNYINYQSPGYQQQDVTGYPRNVYYYENTGTGGTPYEIGSSPVQYAENNNNNKEAEYDGEIEDPPSTIGYFDIYKIKYSPGNKYLNSQINAENRKFTVDNDPSSTEIDSSKFKDEVKIDVDKEKTHATEKIEKLSEKHSGELT